MWFNKETENISMIRAIVENDIAELNKINREELGYDYPLDKSLVQLRKLLKDSVLVY